MGNIIIRTNEVQEWMETNWHIYASQDIRGKLARFWVNNNKQFKITHGDKVLYQGDFLNTAVLTWEKYFN